ncbi:hypothetical protein LOC67_07525 [Stieleria sp. JC731]|uniref:hypothetical protein n=1 Tax=Pirellulaceae TaxID=2691357 RepID=UPI001E37A3FA|nr:hypothetical protein [Stieleria sp. JC731]MCC9600406.1 hypothetical protein [Stieleria sp. JC731]
MTRWTFTTRSNSFSKIDIAPVRRSWLAEQTLADIQHQQLIADGSPIDAAEIFDIQIVDSESDEIVIEGDLRNGINTAAMHDAGVFRVCGSVGDYAGCSLRGGTLLVEGNAADFLGAPLGTKKSGMSRGEIIVRGDAGNYAGHRMRRGTITIAGSAGDFLAASMVAGTIGVGGTFGRSPCVGMRRGTTILPKANLDMFASEKSPDTEKSTYTAANLYRPVFFSLFQGELMRSVVSQLGGETVHRIRADRRVDGQGEILFPAR